MKIASTDNKTLNIELTQQEWFDLGKNAGWLEAAPQFVEAAKGKKKKGRCWVGYEPVPGKKPFEDGSCKKK